MERRRVLLELPVPETAEELMAQCLELWHGIDVATVRAMALSMPTRIADCIELEGGRIPY